MYVFDISKEETLKNIISKGVSSIAAVALTN